MMNMQHARCLRADDWKRIDRIVDGALAWKGTVSVDIALLKQASRRNEQMLIAIFLTLLGTLAAVLVK